MVSFHTIYDAGTMGAVDQWTFVSMFCWAAALSAALFFWWRRLWKLPKTTIREDLYRHVAPLVWTAVIAAASFSYLAFIIVAQAVWSFDYSHHRYDTLDGCVENFTEVVEIERKLAVDTFTLNGRRFSLSDSGWRLGYHVSHRFGSPISEGARVRAFANGSRLLKIEVAPNGCRGDVQKPI
jgi:hypothetical protein